MLSGKISSPEDSIGQESAQELIRGHEREHDQALTFSRRLAPEIVSRLGLNTRKAGREEALGCLLGEALTASQEGRRVSFSLNSNHYTGRSRYCGRSYTRTHIRDGVEALQEVGFIHVFKAPRWPAGRGEQSSAEATPLLWEAVGPSPRILRIKRELVRLRDAEKQLIPYEDDDFSRGRRRDVEAVNEMMRAARLGTVNPTVTVLDDGRWVFPELRGGGGYIARADSRDLHVVHNNGRWEEGGRATGLFTQQLPGAERRRLTINESEVRVLDFSCSHLNIAYTQAGLVLNGDAYQIAGWEDHRPLVKVATNVAINARKGRWQAEAAIAHDLAVRRSEREGLGDAEEMKATAEDRRVAAAVLDAVEEHHDRIRGVFYTGNGTRFQRPEADVLLGTMLDAKRRGITILPCYDEFAVPEDDAGLVHELMAANWSAKIGSKTTIRVH